MALQSGHSWPAGTLTLLVTLTSSGACSITLTGLTGLQPPLTVVILLAAVTLGPRPVAPALQTLHTIPRLSEELLAELAPGGPAVTLARYGGSGGYMLDSGGLTRSSRILISICTEKGFSRKTKLFLTL